ncbi:glycosyltransferase family 2 protein [Arundinibacter roseus]|uniref:Glycosyltransferase family 2 protein n=1 Tax=Arundinibacter roseus TaxID=2070510 RepID=A0A4R4JV93_9BACT|nr:glycosyltransferase family 2 protein [Arundinibacter roseus]TDB58644.1 glycosyltransferase family 2 protein [Arundinibacter roseus]
MKIAIVFPIFNGLEFTKVCLKNLKTCLKDNDLNNTYDIIIINDGSTDESSSWITKNYPEIILIQGNGNLWWSEGMNYGLNYSFNVLRVDFVLCWNNDIIADINYFKNLNYELSLLKENEFLCSKIYYKINTNYDKKLIFAAGCGFNKNTGKITIYGNGQDNNSIYEAKRYVDWSGGMGMLISQKLFSLNGLFNSTQFPQYKGDADYCLRGKELGFKLKFCPNLEIYNDAKNSGINNNYNDINNLINLLSSRRSIYNLRLNYNFYARHCGILGFISGFSLTYLRYLKLVLRAIFYTI